jgi:hypothetical protein
MEAGPKSDLEDKADASPKVRPMPIFFTDDGTFSTKKVFSYLKL